MGQTVDALGGVKVTGATRRAHMATTFMGAYEARERVNESGRKRMIMVAAAVAAVIISLGALIAS